MLRARGLLQATENCRREAANVCTASVKDKEREVAVDRPIQILTRIPSLTDAHAVLTSAHEPKYLRRALLPCPTDCIARAAVIGG